MPLGTETNTIGERVIPAGKLQFAEFSQRHSSKESICLEMWQPVESVLSFSRWGQRQRKFKDLSKDYGVGILVETRPNLWASGTKQYDASGGITDAANG